MMVLAGEMLSTEDAARLLMDEAAKTSTDNITLIVVRVHGEAIRQKESE
ncbi:hypothetical protein [Methanogenium cariaci]|nr:hypothetical protein [Methanogenium cariaci]